ncbi:PilN domain-containing protein [Pseudofrancisella aestuarii]|uniref:PilN domain-containing protein n=1 Tax=Pseudofrancisella aestuarii TaxID=2670347 RepID=A0ABV9TB28_9GAMM|nr:PilN domain-containing protein [Pseudofrancisella aestuarii]
MISINFIRGRWQKQLVLYWIIDVAFIALISFVIMYVVSIIAYWPTSLKLETKDYAQSKVMQLSKEIAGYTEMKKRRDLLLDTADDFARIQKSQYYVLLGIENISQAIPDGIYLENLKYIEKTKSVVLTGQVLNLKLLSDFIKSLETKFGLKKAELTNLGPEKQGQRSFIISLNFDKDNMVGS